ncbi:hypothetical protein MLD38_028759 [Melastoma candidum]|uniref:Uncharacterized protein n=1 Tax=Melastoma candidum TaxID=119954 RepID=A0ACB9N7R0_9MYRT|nr:hypothetical protein MLD38_028759 [Melastoma candidum]
MGITSKTQVASFICLLLFISFSGTTRGKMFCDDTYAVVAPCVEERCNDLCWTKKFDNFYGSKCTQDSVCTCYHGC